jgi:dynein heavy chain
VDHERPDLQETAMRLVRQLAEYTISLKELEDNLLARLAASQGDILEDIPLIEGLEETKATAVRIAEKVKEAKATEASISKAREVYRPVALRGSLVYFLISSLSSLDRVYHYSMANFVRIMTKAMALTPGGRPEPGEPGVPSAGVGQDVGERVKALVGTLSLQLFNYVSQGLFERHKLLVATQLCMRILHKHGELSTEKFQYLLRGPKVVGPTNPVPEWLPESSWQSVLALKEMHDYHALAEDLVSSAKRWREWLELERPEDEPLPGDWKRMPEFNRLLLFHALRPDRLTAAMSKFVAGTLGKEYVTSQPFNLERSFQDAQPGTPIFVFLSPGVDVAGSVEALGRKLGFTAENGRYFSVSLGQGQEAIAMNYLNQAHKNGGWVLLQNIHLTIDWTSGPLEKRIDKLADGAHPDFRLFLSAQAPPTLERPLPVSILQASILLTNEPPEGLKANLLRAYGNFSEDIVEGCAKQTEYRSILFALSFFHATLLERKKFGVGNQPGARSGIGWNMGYPFNLGDLLCCGQLAANYLDNSSRVPWEDLRYLIGEIMYGGHIVEDWDRRLAGAYLHKYFQEVSRAGH